MEGRDLCNSEIASICPQGPVFGVDWHKAKGRFEVRFGLKTPRAQGPQYGDRVIDTKQLQRKRILWDVVIFILPPSR